MTLDNVVVLHAHTGWLNVVAGFGEEVTVLPDEPWADVAADLCARHPGFPRRTVERIVTRVAEQYRYAKITTFVPVLVRRQVGAQLRYVEDIPISDLQVEQRSTGQSARPAGDAVRSRLLPQQAVPYHSGGEHLGD